MVRTFQAKAGFHVWLLVALVAVLTFISLWYKNAIIGFAGLILLSLIVERIIHTTYTLTDDGHLIIHKGHFTRDLMIALKDITTIEGCRSFNIFGCHLLEYLLIHYGTSNSTTSVMPVTPDEFLECLEKKRRLLP